MLLFRGPHWDRGLPTDELGPKNQPTALKESEVKRILGQMEASKAKPVPTVSFRLGDPVKVVDGPFSETKEAVGGYLVLQADSLDEAVEIARSMPTLRHGISVEVRPILAECPIFQRHPDLVRRATDRPAEQLRVAAAA